MPWHPRPNVLKLQRKNDELTFALIRVREELRQKEASLVGFEVLLDERSERIDRLTVQIDQLRQQNKKLDAECEHLAEIVRSEVRSSLPIANGCFGSQ